MIKDDEIMYDNNIPNNLSAKKLYCRQQKLIKSTSLLNAHQQLRNGSPIC